MRREKRVFRGVRFSVYQWRQKMFDGTYETFERVERPPTAQVIASVNGKLVLADEVQPGRKRHLGLFGGVVEEGERPLAAAKRELLEEAGMVADRWKLLKVFAHPLSSIRFDMYFFAATDCRRVAEPRLEPGERITPKTVTLKRLLSCKGIRIGADAKIYLRDIGEDGRKRAQFRSMLRLKDR